MDDAEARLRLIAMLRGAYSGELAAGLAYRGHAASLRDARERVEVRRIEAEEWLHRGEVRRLLAELEARPHPWRELMMACIGCAVAVSCHVGGRFLPLYFAGRLEHANIGEYVAGARYARQLGLEEHERALGEMAAVEQRHETYFSTLVAGHRWLPLLRRYFTWS